MSSSPTLYFIFEMLKKAVNETILFFSPPTAGWPGADHRGCGGPDQVQHVLRLLRGEFQCGSRIVNHRWRHHLRHRLLRMLRCLQGELLHDYDRKLRKYPMIIA